jgi:hypothetical protein
MKVEGRLRRSAGAMQAGESSPQSGRGRYRSTSRAGDGTAAASSGANDAKYCCAGKTMGGCEDRRAADRVAMGKDLGCEQNTGGWPERR